jgi:hypothetical protein
MEDRSQEIANLQVKLTLLRREESQWLSILADDSQSASSHHDARMELQKIMAEIILTVRNIRKLETAR